MSASAGGGGSMMDEQSYVFGIVVKMHGENNGHHQPSMLTHNVAFQNSAPLDAYGYEPPSENYNKIIENRSGTSSKIGILKTQLRTKEKENHTGINAPNILKFKNGYTNVINNIHEILRELLNTNETKADRIKIFKTKIIKYISEVKQNIFHLILTQQLDAYIEEFIKDIINRQTEIPNKNTRITETHIIFINECASLLDNFLKEFYEEYNKHNNTYTTEIYKNKRHRIIDGNSGLPEYSFEGQHDGEMPDAGFSVIIYENTELHELWKVYCVEYGFHPDIIKTQEGAILKMDPNDNMIGTPMYMFLRWCEQFFNKIDEKSAYIIFLKVLSVDYSVIGAVSEYGNVTTSEILCFVNLLKQIVSREPNEVSAICYIFSCCKYEPSKKDELVEIENTYQYIPTPQEVGIVKLINSKNYSSSTNDKDQQQVVAQLFAEFVEPGSTPNYFTFNGRNTFENLTQEDPSIWDDDDDHIFGGKKRRKTKRGKKTRRNRKT